MLDSVLFPFGLVAAACWVTPVWLLSILKKDASIIDIFWGAGFVALATGYAVRQEIATGRSLVLLGGVALWGLRLSIYILWRNHGKGEDPRYQAMRRSRGAGFWWQSLFTVFLLQGVILWWVSFPLAMIQHPEAPSRFVPLDLFAALVFATGLLFESVGDWQLARFKADPGNRGKVMDRGLWRLTRHPNYFGDFAVWWGLFLFAVSTPGALWTVISPVVMSFLLMKVSGVALLERGLTNSKPQYAEYIRKTNAFFPWLPRK